MALPHLSTARTRVTVLPPERADLMLDFYLRNRAHLTPWEPSRDESFYTLSHWHGRLRDSYGQFFNGSAIHLVALDPLQLHPHHDGHVQGLSPRLCRR